MTKATYKKPTFRYQPSRFEITDSDVRRLAERRAELNHYGSNLITQMMGDPDPTISLYTVQRIRDGTDYIRSESHRLSEKKLDPFDKLVLRDCRATGEVVEAYMDYFHHPGKVKKEKNRPRIEDCVNGIFGRGSWSSIRNALKPKNYPHRTIHEYVEHFSDMAGRRLDSDLMLDGHRDLDRKLKKNFRKKLDEAKEANDRFMMESGLLEEPGEYELGFSRHGFSFWEPHIMRASIDSDRIIVHRDEDGEYQFFNGHNMLILSHEVGGHMNHDVYSEAIMPQEMVVRPDNWFYFSHSPSQEGTALAMEQFGLEWMKSNNGDIGLSEEDIRGVELFMERYIESKLPKVFYTFLNIRQRVEGKGDAERDLANLMRVSYYHQDQIWMQEDQMAIDAMAHMPYFVGNQRTQKMIKKMRRKDVSEDKIQHALMAGVWTDPKAQERFIFEHYLPAIK